MFSLTYDDNGGSGCANKSPIKKEKGLTWGNSCTPTRAGYKFDGWVVDGSLVQPANLSGTTVEKKQKLNGN